MRRQAERAIASVKSECPLRKVELLVRGGPRLLSVLRGQLPSRPPSPRNPEVRRAWPGL
ncbi:MAG TPA: hypothetical protein VEL12_16625 [Candidatus Nitrosopolaris sp.]|nr:hypothetical protein [Candidatus Nitrosopolaris sp.]